MTYKKRYFWLFVLPVVAIFVLVVLVPGIVGITGSFKNWQVGADGIGEGWTFDNYSKTWADEAFWDSVWFTTKFAVLTVLLVNIIGFSFAFMLTRPFKGKNFFRAAFFMPNLIGGLVLGYIWSQIFANLFSDLGYDSWIGGTNTQGLLALVTVVAWQMSGYVMVIYIAQLQNVRTDLIEAAKVSGAGPITRFRKVIIPQMMPAITIALFLVLTRGFQTFDQNLSLTNGSSGTGMIALNIYKTAFTAIGGFDLGWAQAKAVIFTILVATIAIAQVRFTSGKEVEA